ncbi:MAG: carboxypeptidase regulatory-like domain-containing protein [Desulfobulbaceae bacterium]|nr:carboxypeptidase regulatory-like domain-containing protein [Desulfobulbaceae bacterium]
MTRSHGFIIVALFLLFWAPGQIPAAENFVFRGQIVDTANKPVGGAEVYVFDSANVKRPADFISNRTGGDGYFRVELPPGHYWTMAIMRVSGASFGPLGKDDKHSGETIEVDSAGKKEFRKDFTIMDLREAARANQKRSEAVIKISGQILNDDGLPVEMAYVLVDQQRKFGDMPQYLSTWTGADGHYVLFLPKGKFFIGASKDFPPESDYNLTKEVDFARDTAGVDLLVPSKASLP